MGKDRVRTCLANRLRLGPASFTGWDRRVDWRARAAAGEEATAHEPLAVIGGGVTADRRGNSILPTVSSYLIKPISSPLCSFVQWQQWIQILQRYSLLSRSYLFTLDLLISHNMKGRIRTKIISLVDWKGLEVFRPPFWLLGHWTRNSSLPPPTSYILWLLPKIGE